MFEIFARDLATNLRHLKLLYVTAYTKSVEATLNIMLVSVMKPLKRSRDEFIPSGITMNNFIGDKSSTKGILPLEVTIAGRPLMTTFFVVYSRIEYNALLGQDWLHPVIIIPSLDFLGWQDGCYSPGRHAIVLD